ncbi:hypothetical protein DFA_01877 [Cavenderia fasciculata]|uniref:Histone RNA hairpin-binding protein RNA-binding domain-containing protein n=1 Tax=Cavenderia fasciculata TaxID=261658 RepID=F4PV83_CACFS|nr:uncharacterized protein DFA_01877 [Cavenderia fasciculata]EGG21991.1 hypothetical protein DFA_01877 [Cavenderia fasciculata]|eukprot:XP_004359842.1 hypothetical protein DFA_01877 [Cavenderia fasciculata]
MATIIPQPTTPSSVSVTPNRQLLKNIKNLPVSSSKKQNKFVTVGTTPKKQPVSTKKNGTTTAAADQFLFTASTPFSLTVPKLETSANNSPVKELSTSDLKVLDRVGGAAVGLISDDADVVPAPSSSVSSKPAIRYSVDFIKSLQGAASVSALTRPKELDYIDESQREAALMQSVYSSTVSASGGSTFGSATKTRTPLFASYNQQHFVSPSPYKASPSSATPFSAAGTVSPAHQFNLSLNGDSLGVIPMQLRHPPLPLPLPMPSLSSSSNNKKASNKLVDNKLAMMMDQSPDTATTTDLVESLKKILKEDNPKRLQARQRQLDIGKATIGYKTFSTAVSKSKRKKSDPKTPNKNQICSKRSWDGQVRKWRRLLHQYDPVGTPLEDDDDLLDDDLEEEDLEEEEENDQMNQNNQNNNNNFSFVNTSIPQISSVYDNITPEMLSL